MNRPIFSLQADRTTLNPLLSPDERAILKVSMVDSFGQAVDLSRHEIKYCLIPIAGTSGVEVARLEGNQLVGLEGGIVEVSALLLWNGEKLQASQRFVVRPFYREYHQTLSLKLFLGQEKHPNPAWAKRVSFEQALEVIRKVDALTLGIPKIVYLVGWQAGGHDWGYPDWGPVDPKLKRQGDPAALDSLKWLIAEDQPYHTTVSLHINMFDAYRSSPLWDEYAKRDVIARDRRGRLFVRGEKFHGETVYCICYTREWQEKLAQQRIDQLLNMLPELVDGHTIHIDAFHSAWKGSPASAWHASPKHGGITLANEIATQREIFKYWRDKGLDVTCEGMEADFVGLQPMIWWFHASHRWQMKIPERLCTRGRTTHRETGDFRFGTSMHGEELFVRDVENLSGFLEQFCRTTLPWYYLSRLERVRVSFPGRLFYSDGVTAGWEHMRRTIRRGNLLLREEDNLFVPALWRETRTIVATSRKGYSERSWVLPEDWAGIKEVDISAITLSGSTLLEHGKKIHAGRVSLELEAGQAVALTPTEQ
jgi:hypothetical protein